jgi:hypothetical protein
MLRHLAKLDQSTIGSNHLAIVASHRMLAALKKSTSQEDIKWPVHLLSEDVSSREDASTSWPSSSGRQEDIPYIPL